MCGIFAIYHPDGTVKFSAAKARELSARQRHRGPDFHGLYQHPVNGNILAHERLAIMDLSCVQPLQGASEEHQVVHNGEIYNWRALRDGILSELPYRTTCDSEAIIKLYEKLHEEPEFEHRLCLELDGVFGFALIYGDEFMAARDPIGVKPLYWGTDAQGRWMFSSEMKVIEDSCLEVCAFPPGHFYTPAKGFVRYYEPDWFRWELATGDADLPALRNALISATEKRLKSDAPIGVLLSGGLDSSLISAISVRALRSVDCDHALRSFSIGLDAQAPDVVAARKIAAFLGTEHHEFTFSVEEGIELIDQLIWHLETYDVTSVRASTPMFFLSRKITEMGIKVVLSGEGSDEIFGGYLYFHNAPDDAEYQKETIRRVNLLSTADCLRADKSTMANSLEVRVPFLDKQFLALAMGMAPAHKRPRPEPGQNGGRPVEKWVLRKAFQDETDPLLPDEILWRQKEQFSDGVGYGWIDQLIEHCTKLISDEEMATAPSLFPHNTPTTKEAFYIRKIFHKHFPSEAAARTVLKWVPKWQQSEDPSGRANAMHESAKKEGESDQKEETDQREESAQPETDQKEESDQKLEDDQKRETDQQPEDQRKESEQKPEADQKRDSDQKKESDQNSEEGDQKREKDREEENDQKQEDDQKRKSDQKLEDNQKKESDKQKENSQNGETAEDEGARLKEHDRKEERDQQPEDRRKESEQKPEGDQKEENDQEPEEKQKEGSDQKEKDQGKEKDQMQKDQNKDSDHKSETDLKESREEDGGQEAEGDRKAEKDQKKEKDQTPEENQKQRSDQKLEDGNQKIENGPLEEIDQDGGDRQKENDREMNGEQWVEKDRKPDDDQKKEDDQKRREGDHGTDQKQENDQETDQKEESDRTPKDEKKRENDTPKKESDQEEKCDQRKGSDQKEEKVIRPNGRCQLL